MLRRTCLRMTSVERHGTGILPVAFNRTVMPETRGRRPCHGIAFTLIELLVVITIIVVLIALLLPSLKEAKDFARQSVCAANQKAIGVAFHFYANDNDDYAVPQQVYRANIGLNWAGPLNYPPWADQYWHNGNALGQYMGNSVDDVGIRTVGGDCKTKSALNCPADWHALNNPSYSMSTVEFASVDPSVRNPWFEMWKTADCQNGQTKMLVVDGTDWLGRFTAGIGYPFYGNPDPEPNGNYSGGTPDCIYNWSRRHRLGANVSFVDGHVEWLRELKTAHDQGLLDVTNPVTGWGQ